MREGVLQRVLQAVFGGGADIGPDNPLPVDITPGVKTATAVLEEATIAAATTTVLADCDAINLGDGTATLALTVKALYGAAALGIRIHVLTSPTNNATGSHTAGASATILTDANAHWVANRLVGLTVYNVTDGSLGVITANTINTATVAALAGGTANAWATDDVYSIPGADYDTEDWDTWNPAFAANLPVVQTKVYEVDPMYLKVLVENLDAGVAVTIVEVIATVGP